MIFSLLIFTVINNYTDPYPDPALLEKYIPSVSPEREIPSQEKMKPRIPYGESLEVDNYGIFEF